MVVYSLQCKCSLHSGCPLILQEATWYKSNFYNYQFIIEKKDMHALSIFVPESTNGGHTTSEKNEHSCQVKASCSRSWATRRYRTEVAFLSRDPLQLTPWTVQVIGRHDWSRFLVDHWGKPGVRCWYWHQSYGGGSISFRSPWKQRRVCFRRKSILDHRRSSLDGRDPCTLLSQPCQASTQSQAKLSAEARSCWHSWSLFPPLPYAGHAPS